MFIFTYINIEHQQSLHQSHSFCSAPQMEWTRGSAIGQGSSATVFIATENQSGHVFAVKTAELSQSESLTREQRIVSTLRCPQIVSYNGYAISSEKGKLFYNLFLEYAPQGTLTDAIRRRGGGLDETTVRSYTRSILLGLHYLHSNGIAHCDIKGQNILITDEGVKIADLGCAKRVHEVSCVDLSVAGTPAYMAPEVARGEQQGFPADVWALGCTVIQMASGQAPWADVSDPVSALYRIGFSNEVPLIPWFMSKQAENFLSKCLKRDPEARWSLDQLLAHDFVQESNLYLLKEIRGSKYLDTPTSVLHQYCLWDSMDHEEPETSQNPTLKSSANNSPLERIRQLSLSTEDNSMSSSKVPNWEWDENWITVRNNSSMEPGRMSSSRRLDHNNNLLKADEPTRSSGWDMTGDIQEDCSLFIFNYSTWANGMNTCNTRRGSRVDETSLFVECKSINQLMFRVISLFVCLRTGFPRRTSPMQIVPTTLMICVLARQGRRQTLKCTCAYQTNPNTIILDRVRLMSLYWNCEGPSLIAFKYMLTGSVRGSTASSTFDYHLDFSFP